MPDLGKAEKNRRIAEAHRESNGGDETNTYRTDDKIEEAIRDAYIEAFALKPGT